MGFLLPRSLKGLLLLNETALLALLVMAGGLGGWYAQQSQRFSAEAVHINALLLGAERVRGDLYGQVEEVVRARLTEDPVALSRYAPQAERIAEQFDVLSRLSGGREERLAVDYLRETYQVVHKDMRKVFTNPYEVTDAVRMKLLDRAHEEWMLADFESALTIFNEIVARRQARLQDSLTRWSRLANVLVPVPIVLALVLVIMSWLRLRQQFLAPLGDMMRDVEQLKDGEPTHRLREQGVNELRELARSFNRMAGELARSRNALVHSERQAALGALVPVLAHNIRNPLASIRATAQVMDPQDGPGELADGQRSIIASVDQLERWTQSLLSYLHPLEPKRRRVRFSEVVDSAAWLLRPTTAARGLTLQREGFADDPLCAIDADLMEQAVYGLLSNALEASPRDGVVTLRLSWDPDRVRLTIEDRGPGIGFAPVATGLSPGPTTKAHGTGLGIPFALKVVQSHDGGIEFEPRPEGGTRVTIALSLGAGDTHAAS